VASGQAESTSIARCASRCGGCVRDRAGRSTTAPRGGRFAEIDRAAPRRLDPRGIGQALEPRDLGATGPAAERQFTMSAGSGRARRQRGSGRQLRTRAMQPSLVGIGDSRKTGPAVNRPQPHL